MPQLQQGFESRQSSVWTRGLLMRFFSRPVWTAALGGPSTGHGYVQVIYLPRAEKAKQRMQVPSLRQQ